VIYSRIKLENDLVNANTSWSNTHGVVAFYAAVIFQKKMDQQSVAFTRYIHRLLETIPEGDSNRSVIT
jgi:hypothetical protein